MPSLEQIIRPFVVDPTTPPVPYVTTSNQPPPDPVTLSIGIGGTSLSDLAQSNPDVAPIQPTTPTTTSTPTTPQIIMKTLSSSYSLSVTLYMTGVVKEKSSQGGTDPYAPVKGSGDPFRTDPGAFSSQDMGYG